MWTGRWVWAATAVVACLLAALCNAMDEIQQEDKQEIRYSIMEAEDVLLELLQWEQEIFSNAEASLSEGKVAVLKGLEALAKKYGRQSSKLKSAAPSEEASSASFTNRQQRLQISSRLQELALVGQQAAYVGFRCFPVSDTIVAASLSLAALVAKQDAVRERHMQEADKYGLDLPIRCMRNALDRAKDTTQSSSFETPTSSSSLSAEQQSAELQRKGCRLLGALADGDASMARLVTEEGGIEVMLQAVDWYRFHSDVANWALWATFILSSEDVHNKAVVVECNGVPIVIRALRNCGDTLEVVRHGFAVLFDLMREHNDSGDDKSTPRLDVWRIRNSALNEGVHEVVVRCMDEFSGTMDVVMMGQGILVGTDYKGEIPKYQPVK